MRPASKITGFNPIFISSKAAVIPAIPAPILEKIHSTVAKIYRLPDMRERLIGLAAEPAISTPEEFTALVRSEIVKWAKAVKDSGAKLD